MRYFPKSNDPDIESAPTPVGVPCLRCDWPIASGDRGFLIPCVEADGETVERPWHHACFVASVVGCGRPDCPHCAPKR